MKPSTSLAIHTYGLRFRNWHILSETRTWTKPCIVFREVQLRCCDTKTQTTSFHLPLCYGQILKATSIKKPWSRHYVFTIILGFCDVILCSFYEKSLFVSFRERKRKYLVSRKSYVYLKTKRQWKCFEEDQFVIFSHPIRKHTF